jgi:carbamoyltransferase
MWERRDDSAVIAVLGIAGYCHDSAAALLVDGRLIAACEEERLSRVKHHAGLPVRACRACLDQAGLDIASVDAVAFYEDPIARLARQLWSGLPGIPATHDSAYLRHDSTRAERQIRERLGYEGPVHFVDHHVAHAASSYHCSGFDEAALLVVDAVGEWATCSHGRAQAGRLELTERDVFPDSLGMFYSAITAYLGFDVNDGEAKVMGLAPYGAPSLVERLRRVIDVDAAGRVRLDMDFFAFLASDEMCSPRLPELLGHPPRARGSGIDPFHCDVARSAQAILEDCLLLKVRHLHDLVPVDDLCLAGGVALNCVANGRIAREGRFRRLFVQPAANDAGAAIGAAACAHLEVGGRPARLGRMRHAYLGPAFGPEEVRRVLAGSAMIARDFDDELALLREVAGRLAAGQVVGWFQGRMEFGPRALGARSILADPRDPGMRERLNRLVKQREDFRPYAPAVLEEEAAAHFELDHASPFMLETCRVTSPIALPAITHVDGSARVQTVGTDDSPLFHGLIREFQRLTGCPMLLNTSFNGRDEPIACTPADAVLCFVRIGLDCLVLERSLLDARDVPAEWRRWVAESVEGPRAHSGGSVYALF